MNLKKKKNIKKIKKSREQRLGAPGRPPLRGLQLTVAAALARLPQGVAGLRRWGSCRRNCGCRHLGALPALPPPPPPLHPPPPLPARRAGPLPSRCLPAEGLGSVAKLPAPAPSGYRMGTGGGGDDTRPGNPLPSSFSGEPGQPGGAASPSARGAEPYLPPPPPPNLTEGCCRIEGRSSRPG